MKAFGKLNNNVESLPVDFNMSSSTSALFRSKQNQNKSVKFNLPQDPFHFQITEPQSPSNYGTNNLSGNSMMNKLHSQNMVLREKEQKIQEMQKELFTHKRRIEELERILKGYHVKITELDMNLKGKRGIYDNLTSLTNTRPHPLQRENEQLSERVAFLINRIRELEERNRIPKSPNPQALIYDSGPRWVRKEHIPCDNVDYLESRLRDTQLRQRQLQSQYQNLRKKHESSKAIQLSYLDETEKDPTRMSWCTRDTSSPKFQLNDKIQRLQMENEKLRRDLRYL